MASDVSKLRRAERLRHYNSGDEPVPWAPRAHLATAEQQLPTAAAGLEQSDDIDCDRARSVQKRATDALHLLQIDPPEQKVETSKQELLDFHRKMWMMRRVELTADQLYKQVRRCGTLQSLPSRPRPRHLAAVTCRHCLVHSLQNPTMAQS